MRAALLGATRGMGRALARRMAERGDELFLLGRDSDELEKSAADLAARREPPAEVRWARLDLEEPETFAEALAAAVRALGGLDALVVSAGLFDTQEALEADRGWMRRVLDVDFARTVELCEVARPHLLADGGGTLCVFSSVAGDRGRKPVVLYGAAKAGLTRYLEALDHRYRAAGLRVVCVKPGFVRTGMTAALDPPPFAGEPDPVARRVLAAIDRGTPVVYAPAPWRLVMAVIKRLPRFVMRRVGF